LLVEFRCEVRNKRQKAKERRQKQGKRKKKKGKRQKQGINLIKYISVN